MISDFILKESVIIIINGKPATVEGICFHSKCPTQYNIEYIDGNGDVATRWVDASDIKPV